MIVIVAILLLNHPTLSDSWLMWSLLLAVWVFRWVQHMRRTEQMSEIVKWIKTHQALH